MSEENSANTNIEETEKPKKASTKKASSKKTVTKKTDTRVRKSDFTSLPGISRNSFGKAVSVYLSYFKQ